MFLRPVGDKNVFIAKEFFQTRHWLAGDCEDLPNRSTVKLDNGGEIAHNLVERPGRQEFQYEKEKSSPCTALVQ